MVTHARNLVRVTVTIDPLDVDLIDRTAALSGTNRSIELRGILAELRPQLRAVVEAFEGDTQARELLSKEAAGAVALELETIAGESEQLRNAFLGAFARLEGAAAAAANEAADPRPSSHGGHTPTPPL